MLTLILAPLALIMLAPAGATLLPKGDSLRNLMVVHRRARSFALMVAIGLAFVSARRAPWAGPAPAPMR